MSIIHLFVLLLLIIVFAEIIIQPTKNQYFADLNLCEVSPQPTVTLWLLLVPDKSYIKH